MAEQVGNTLQFGRVIYVEPNNNIEGTGRGTNFTFKPEDYSILVDLQVDVVDRYAYNGSGTKSQIQYTLEWDAKGTKTSLFKGTNGMLSTRALDTSFDDMMNNVNQEAIGINSIEIKYNSWNYPEVNITFTDIRGASLLSGADYIHTPLAGNVNKAKYANNFANTFFSTFFRFPYPRYTLVVKGFYGRPVSYTLCVNDFKTRFNSGTGNFDITVSFIGYMYGLLTDIPMRLLFAAPYSEYVGSKYWHEMTVDKKMFLYADTETPMYTFFELNENLKALNQRIEQIKELAELVEKEKQLEARKTGLEEIKAIYENYIKSFNDNSNKKGVKEFYPPVYKTNEEIANGTESETRKYIVVLSEVSSETDQFNPYACENCSGTGLVDEIVYSVASGNWGTSSTPHKTGNKVECPTCHGSKIDPKKKDANLDCQEIDDNITLKENLVEKIKEYNEIPANAEKKVTFIRQITPEKASQHLKGTIVYGQRVDEGGTTLPFDFINQDLTDKVVFQDVAEADKEELTKFLKEEGLTAAKYMHDNAHINYVAVDVLKVNEFETSVGIGLNGIDDLIKSVAEDLKQEQEKIYTQLLGFKVSLKNVMDMCLAHLETFMECMYACMDKIKEKNRTLANARLNLTETDLVATTEELYLPPFFAFRKINPKTDEYEDQWIGDDIRFSNRDMFQEIRLVDGLINGSLKAEQDAIEKAKIFISNTVSEEYPTIGTDYLPTFPNDFLAKKNPYGKVDGTLESLIGMFALRCVLASIYVVDYPDIGSRFDSSNNNKKIELFKTLGENDAENFKLRKEDFKKFRENYAGAFKLLTWDNFSNYITGKPDGSIVKGDKQHRYFSKNIDSPLFTKQGIDNYIVSYGCTKNGLRATVPLYFDSIEDAAEIANSIYTHYSTSAGTETNGFGIYRDYAMPIVKLDKSDNEFSTAVETIESAFSKLGMKEVGWYAKNSDNWRKYISGPPKAMTDITNDKYWFPTLVLASDIKNKPDLDNENRGSDERGNIYDGKGYVDKERGRVLVNAFEPMERLTTIEDFFTGDDSSWFHKDDRVRIKNSNNNDAYLEKTIIPKMIGGDDVTLYALPCGNGTLFESEFYLSQNYGTTVSEETKLLRKAFLFLHSLPTSEYGAFGHVLASIIKKTYTPSITDIPYASMLFIGALYYREQYNASSASDDNFIYYPSSYKKASKYQMITYDDFKRRDNDEKDEVRRPLNPILETSSNKYKVIVDTALENKIEELEVRKTNSRFDNALREYIDGDRNQDARYCGFWKVRPEVKKQFIDIFVEWAKTEFKDIDEALSLKKKNGEIFTPSDIETYRNIVNDKVFKGGYAGTNKYGIPSGTSYNDYVKNTFHESVFLYHNRLGASNEDNALISMFKLDTSPLRAINKLLTSGSVVTVAFPRVLMTRDMFSPSWDEERDALRTDNRSLEAAWNAFKSAIEKAFDDDAEQEKDDEHMVGDNPPANITPETKLALYETLKNLHDKWLITTHKSKYEYTPYHSSKELLATDAKTIGDHFFYINSFYEDVGDEIMLNVDELPKQIQTVIDSVSEACSLYSFMYDVANQARVQLLALPVFNDLSDPKYVRQMFTPIPYDDLNINEISTETQYVFMYPEEASKHLGSLGDSEDSDERYKFADDSFMLVTESGTENSGNYPVTFTKTEERNVPVIGVTFAKQNQSFFKNINVSMDNPKTTEVAIQNTFMIANRYRGGNNQITAVGQDLFSIYSNYSYECTVEMMGCACIMPLMYFQLNNIPMFKGTYIIYNVSHSITPGNMTTTFSGQRLSRFRKKRNENAISCAPNEDGLLSSSFYTMYDINGNPIGCYTTSSNKLENESVYQEMTKKTGVEKEALRAVEYAETHYTGGFFPDGKLKLYYDPWVAYSNGVRGSDLFVSSQFSTSYTAPNTYDGNTSKIEAAKQELGGNESASGFTLTGAFGIPGQCYDDCGASSIGTFYEMCGSGFGNQGTYFAELLNKKTDMRDALKNKDWKKFAKLYKGAGGATPTGVYCSGDDANFTNYAKDLETGYNEAVKANQSNVDTYVPSKGQDIHITEPGHNPHAEASKSYANQNPLDVRKAINKLNSNTKVVLQGCDGINKTGKHKDKNGNLVDYTYRGKTLISTPEHQANPGSKPEGWPVHLCATYVKCALKAGGYPYFSCDGGDCADLLEKNGFEEIYYSKPGDPWSGSSIDSKWQPGDVMTISRELCKTNGLSNYGHIAMWNGTNWVSDFKQNNCICYGSKETGAKNVWNNGGYRFFRYRNKVNM